MSKQTFKAKFKAELPGLIERKLTPADGTEAKKIGAAELRLRLKLPPALRAYYEIAGGLELNTRHNRLYAPQDLIVESGKLVFMEENQAVVFWGMDLRSLKQPDPEVFQAANAKELIWYSEELNFSDWIIKMWRWQLGLDAGN